MLHAKPKAGGIAACQQPSLVAAMLAVDGPDGVDDEFHLANVVGPCQLGFAGAGPVERAALGEQLRTRSPMNRAIHAAAAKQSAVCCVDDSIHGALGNVSTNNT